MIVDWLNWTTCKATSSLYYVKNLKYTQKKGDENMNSKIVELLKQFRQLSKEEQAELIKIIRCQRR